MNEFTFGRIQFAANLVAFYREGCDLLDKWERLEGAGDEIPGEAYPFTESFDEVLARVSSFVQTVQEWAGLSE